MEFFPVVIYKVYGRNFYSSALILRIFWKFIENCMSIQLLKCISITCRVYCDAFCANLEIRVVKTASRSRIVFVFWLCRTRLRI